MSIQFCAGGGKREERLAYVAICACALASDCVLMATEGYYGPVVNDARAYYAGHLVGPKWEVVYNGPVLSSTVISSSYCVVPGIAMYI